MDERLYKKLEYMGIRRDVGMAAYTSFRAGGNASAFVEPKTDEQLMDALSACAEYGVDWFVMGNGTNLLVSDRGIDALVIRLGDTFSGTEQNGADFCVRAGGLMGAFSKYTVDMGYMGLEWAAGIPGSVGGAVAMNAGAYGGEIKNVLTGVTFISNGELKEEAPPADSLGYRRSIYSSPERIVLSAKFTLLPDDGGARQRMEEYSRRRREKQPLSYPSAGSTFKRPEGHFAGALIEAAGLKGKRIGGAAVSELHAGFIVNLGGASAADIYALIRLVQREVYESSGVMLEPEVRLTGEF